MLSSLVYKAGGNPADSHSFPIVSDLPTGTIPLGIVDNGRGEGPVFSLPEPDPSSLQHIGIFGETRHGKSYLLKHIARERMLGGNPVWIFDLEDDFLCLASAVPEPNEPIVVAPEHLRINFFQPPGDWISPRSWLEIVSLILRGETFIRDGGQNLFNDSLLRLMKSKAVGQYPSLSEVLSYFEGLKLSGSEVRGKTWQESLINRVRMLLNAFTEMSRVTSSGMLELLAERSVIFRLRGKAGIPLHFFVNFLLAWLSCYKEGRQK